MMILDVDSYLHDMFDNPHADVIPILQHIYHFQINRGEMVVV